MDCISTFVILPEKKIILEYLSGIMTPEDLIGLKIRESRHQNYNPLFDSIMDIRDTSINVGKEGVFQLLDFVRNRPDIFGLAKTAYLTSRPNHVVAASLLLLYKGDLPLIPKIFSTVEAAINWVFNSREMDKSVYEQINQLRESGRNPLKQSAS